MNCQINVNSILPTQLPHKFSYIVAILIPNHFESPNSTVRDTEFRASFFCHFKKLRCKSLFIVNVTFKSQILMYSSAFCSVGLQAYNLKSPNLSLDEVYQDFRLVTLIEISNCQNIEAWGIL
jgi:hypothetical protein